MEIEDILNIQYHIKKMVLKAVNKFPTVDDAAGSLGVSKKTLYKYMSMYDIKWNNEEKLYKMKTLN